jgi:hypothetical protein
MSAALRTVNKVDLIRQYLWYCHLPQSGKVKNKVKCALNMRCFAPRFFGYALARKGQGRRQSLAQNDKVESALRKE